MNTFIFVKQEKAEVLILALWSVDIMKLESDYSEENLSSFVVALNISGQEGHGGNMFGFVIASGLYLPERSSFLLMPRPIAIVRTIKKAAPGKPRYGS